MGKQFRSMLGSDVCFLELPCEADPTELDALVAKLRAGDPSVRQRIVELHVRLVTSIAGRMVASNLVDDAIQEANAALLEIVDYAPIALTDNNITAYITASVRFEIRRLMGCNRVVYMPGRTFRDRAAKGKISRDGNNFEPTLVGVVSTMKLVMTEEREALSVDHDIFSINQYMPGYTIPEARPETPSVETLDVLDHAIQTSQEQSFVEMAREGYTFKEIGERYDVSTSWVGKVISRVEKRFDDYMTA